MSKRPGLTPSDKLILAVLGAITGAWIGVVVTMIYIGLTAR